MAKYLSKTQSSRQIVTCILAALVSRNKPLSKRIVAAKDAFWAALMAVFDSSPRFMQPLKLLMTNPLNDEARASVLTFLQNPGLKIPADLIEKAKDYEQLFQRPGLRGDGTRAPRPSPGKKKITLLKPSEEAPHKPQLKMKGLLSLMPSRLPGGPTSFMAKGIISTQKPAIQATISHAAPIAKGSELYTVWYATDRAVANAKAVEKRYSAKRDPKGDIHYGKCYVEIPASHKIGSLGSSLLWRAFTGEDDRLKINSYSEFAAAAFWADVHQAMVDAALKDPEKKNKRLAVVFIHGYMTSFAAAALRAAQIGADLRVAGPMAFYAWPSRNRYTCYMADEATIQNSEDRIVTFLTDFSAKAGADEVHVIAHSMGNRALMALLQNALARANQNQKTLFKNIILAAPDIDRDLFARLAPAYAQVADRTTLYVSGRDQAVSLSKFLHRDDRAGFVPPVTVIPGVDTIVVSKVDLSVIGHNYFASLKVMLGDIYALITHGSGPGARIGLRELSLGQLPYWEIRR